MTRAILCKIGFHDYVECNRGVISKNGVSFYAYLRECKNCNKRQYKRMRIFDKPKWTDA